MGKKWVLSLSLVVVSGCAQFPDLGQAISALYPTKEGSGTLRGHSPGQGPFNFEWALSGDRSIAPLQVFDNGLQTWLQFAAGTPVPAIFARTGIVSEGVSAAIQDRLLTSVQQNAYVVLNEVPEQLVFRGGHLQAVGRRARPVAANVDSVNPVFAAAVVTPIDDVSAGHETSLVPVTGSDQVGRVADAGPTGVNPQAFFESDLNVAVGTAGTADVLAGTPASSGESQTEALTARFSVDRTDGNLRLALMRWAGASGWDFGPEHWGVDVDIPIIGAATFELPFIEAVQALVSSTELAGHPLQPCFYSNRVLRVVPYAQPCNRGTAQMVTA